jgi:hypothetical protein
VLDKIDFVCRSKTDPELQREQSCRALVDEIAALKWDLAQTRLELNRCRNLNSHGSAGMGYMGSRTMVNGNGVDNKFLSNGHADRFLKSEPSSSSVSTVSGLTLSVGTQKWRFS